MYAYQLPRCRSHRAILQTAALAALVVAIGSSSAPKVCGQVADPNSVIRKISTLSEKLELTTNSSRILTLDKNIPRVQVNNPELLAVTPLSANQVQISAKKAGVTQVNLWDQDGEIHTVDVQIYGDARELQVALQTQFPHASIKVYRYSESLVLTGFVDRPDHISPIMALAQDYAPKVIDNINVGGVQQVLLRVKVMEVNRTKLRELGVDWGFLNGESILAASNVSGLIRASGSIFNGGGNLVKTGSQIGSGGQTFQFGVFKGNGAFIGVLDALQQNNVAKILAQPDIVAVSGRPAKFQDGGEIPIPVPQSLGTTTIEFKPFGTIVDFLPIVLGNGNIRLEVRPQISSPDYSKAVNVNGTLVPALNTRQVDTAVEMKAGQTFAIGGLIQELTTTQKAGLPYISDVPVFGVPFRKTSDVVQETELLIMITPEFVDPIDGFEAPCGGPGMSTTSPTNRGLYCAGQVEVPTYCNPTQGIGSCGGDDCNGGACAAGGCATGGCSNGGTGGMIGGGTNVVLPGGTGYDDGPAMAPTQSVVVPGGEQMLPPQEPANGSVEPGAAPAPGELPPHIPPQQGAQTLPEDITLPIANDGQAGAGPSNSVAPPVPATPVTAPIPQAPLPATPPQAPVPTNESAWYVPATPVAPAAPAPVYTAPRPYSPQRQPVFLRNASRPYNPQSTQTQPAAQQPQAGLIGPVGYDVQ